MSASSLLATALFRKRNRNASGSDKPYKCGRPTMRQNNLLDVKVQKQKVKVIKHNPMISEPMPKYLSTGHRFANTSNPTLTASSSAQYQYPAHGSATVFIHYV